VPDHAHAALAPADLARQRGDPQRVLARQIAAPDEGSAAGLEQDLQRQAFALEAGIDDAVESLLRRIDLPSCQLVRYRPFSTRRSRASVSGSASR